MTFELTNLPLASCPSRGRQASHVGSLSHQLGCILAIGRRTLHHSKKCPYCESPSFFFIHDAVVDQICVGDLGSDLELDLVLYARPWPSGEASRGAQHWPELAPALGFGRSSACTSAGRRTGQRSPPSRRSGQEAAHPGAAQSGPGRGEPRRAASESSSLLHEAALEALRGSAPRTEPQLPVWAVPPG